MEYSTKQDITVSQPGIYVVEVRNGSGCVLRQSVTLKNSAKSLQADFLMPTRATVGDTVVALEITKPIPEQIVWKLPVEAYKVRQTSSTVHFVPTVAGSFVVEMKALSSGCENVVRHDLQVEQRGIPIADASGADLIEKVEVFPNPNFGRFSVRVKLKTARAVLLNLVRDLTNEVVYTASDKDKSSYQFEIDLNVTTGVYVLVVQAAAARLTTKVLITR